MAEADIVCSTEIWNGDASWDYAGYQAFQVLAPTCEGRARRAAGIALIFSSLSHGRVLEKISKRYFQILSVVYNSTRMVGVYLAPLVTEEVLPKIFRHLTRMSQEAAVLLGDLNGRPPR